MERYRSPYRRGRTSSGARRTEKKSSTLGNQLSAAAVLLAFIIILACSGGNKSSALRNTASELLGRNILNELEDKGTAKDNMAEFIRCMFSYPESSRKDAEEEITRDIRENERTVTAAEITDSEPAAEEEPPE
ncbi:MAG: hypothetical protein PUD43_10145 [Clostridia bacterium]|nr:hypothetical protein [Clostridia bacterium]